MRLTAVLSGLALSLLAGAAMACPAPDRCGDRYGASAYERYDDDARYAPPAYDDGYADDGRYDDEDEDERYDDRYAPQGYPDAPAAWADRRGLYIHGHRGEPCGCFAPPPPCNCEGLTLSSNFFDGAGGVGPIPDGGYYGGGGYYYVGGGSGASSHAFASASARASANVSVRYRGGGHYRPPGGHGGHKGGGGKRH